MTSDRSTRRRVPQLMFVAGSLLVTVLPAMAVAQTAESAAPQVYGLTTAQKAALDREGNSERTGARTLAGGGDRQIHGEVGAMIGTNGARGAFGTMAVPLGDTGDAIVSFESSRYGDRRHR